MKKLLLGLFIAAPAFAHHSTSIDDLSRTVTINGTVRKFEWSNPHVWLWVDVPAAGGSPATTWGIESGAPVQLNRNGIKWNSFRAGDQVTVTMHPLRSGKNGGLFLRAKFADGHMIAGQDPAALALPPNPAETAPKP